MTHEERLARFHLVGEELSALEALPAPLGNRATIERALSVRALSAQLAVISGALAEDDAGDDAH